MGLGSGVKAWKQGPRLETFLMRTWRSWVADLEGESGFPVSLSSVLGCIRPYKQQPNLIQGSNVGSLLLDDDFLGPKLPLLGNKETRPSRYEDKEVPRDWNRCFTDQCLMQQKTKQLD